MNNFTLRQTHKTLCLIGGDFNMNLSLKRVCIHSYGFVKYVGGMFNVNRNNHKTSFLDLRNINL